MIVLDASVLIAHLDATDSYHERACELLLLAADHNEPLGASPITLAEMLVGPAVTVWPYGAAPEATDTESK